MSFDLGRSENTPSFFRLAAMVLTAVALVVCVWAMGGHFHFARFTTLSLLALALGCFWLEPLRSSASISDSKVLQLVALCVFVQGGVQLFVQTDIFDTGVEAIRAELAAPTPVTARLTLSTWQTKSWLSMFAIGAVGFFLSAALFNTEKSRVVLLAIIAAIGATQVMWGLIQVVRFPEAIVPGVSNPGGSQPFGSFLNRNHGADFLGMALVCTLGLLCWFYRRDLRSRIGAYQNNTIRQTLQSPVGIGLWIGSCWLVVGLAVSFSRGALLSVFVALIMTYVCWKQAYKTRPWLLIVMVAVVAGGVSFSVQVMGLGDRLERGLDGLEIDTVLANERLTHWQEALPALEHYLPLGSGLGTYGYSYLPFGPKPENGWFTHAHNQYLEVGMEAGIPGLVLLFVGVWLALRTCLKLCRNDRSASEQGLGVAAFGAVVMQCAHATTDFGLMMPANLLAISLLLGAASGAGPHWGSRHPLRSDHVWSVCLSSIVSLLVAAAMWHQMACVRADSLLEMTHFSPAALAPESEQATEWISQLDAELQQSPDNEELLARLIQLRLHRAHRQRYDSVVAVEKPQPAIWDYTSLNGLISKICASESDAALVKEEQERLRANRDMQLVTEELERSLLLNPLQPRVHYRIAQVNIAIGKEWEQPLANSMRLSVVDPRMSLGNGLLAWAVGDYESMIQQWRQTLDTAPTNLPLIYSLAGQSLSHDQIVDDLMPDRWVVPYRLALMVEKRSQRLSQQLFEKADHVAEKNIAGEQARSRARAHIAIAQKDYSKASGFFAEAIVEFPRDPDLRFRYASALLMLGDAKQAADQARVAMNLKPGRSQYRQLFERARSQHLKQSAQE